MPLDLVMGVTDNEGRTEKTYDEYVQQVKDRAEECYGVAREHLRVAAERRKKTYDIRVKEATFRVNDWVWYWYPRRYQKKSPKWQRSYVGPYLIIRAIPPVNFVIQKSARGKPVVVHIDKLKKCYGQTPDSWLTDPEPERCEDSAPTVVSSGDPVKADNVIEVLPERRHRHRARLKPFEESRLPTIDETPEGDAIESEVTRPKRDNRRMPQRFRDYTCTRVILDRRSGDDILKAVHDESIVDVDSKQHQIELPSVVRWPSGQY
jgi:hypothetical protein